MMADYWSLRDTKAGEPMTVNVATIGTIYTDGVTLIFDGQAESSKHYKCNASIAFTAGMRVKVVKIGGSYIVEYPIGAPKQ